MLPIPFIEHVPKLYSQGQFNKTRPDVVALASFWDISYRRLSNEIFDMYWFKLVERVPHSLLEEWGYYLNADIRNTDNDFTKRRKIYDAVRTHKNRGTWEFDAKLRIDSITSYSAFIFKIFDSDDCIEMAGLPDEPVEYYWSTESCGDSAGDLNLGTWEVGLFTEPVIAGNIYIDCHEGFHTPELTADQIQQIVDNIATDIVPAYMRVFLGYRDSSGGFIQYSGGII